MEGTVGTLPWRSRPRQTDQETASPASRLIPTPPSCCSLAGPATRCLVKYILRRTLADYLTNLEMIRNERFGLYQACWGNWRSLGPCCCRISNWFADQTRNQRFPGLVCGPGLRTRFADQKFADQGFADQIRRPRLRTRFTSQNGIINVNKIKTESLERTLANKIRTESLERKTESLEQCSGRMVQELNGPNSKVV